LCILLASAAHGGARAVLEKAGFMGALALGAGYDWSPDHATDFSLGGYRISDNTYYQANFSYRYSPWQIPYLINTWQPLHVGFFMVYALNGNRYFLSSPEKYPTPGYYDQTALRYGLELGSTYIFTSKNFSVGYRLRVFDTGLIAAYNNTDSGLTYSVSSGLALHYFF
jgi:hypothetical protein